MPWLKRRMAGRGGQSRQCRSWSTCPGWHDCEGWQNPGAGVTFLSRARTSTDICVHPLPWRSSPSCDLVHIYMDNTVMVILGKPMMKLLTVFTTGPEGVQQWRPGAITEQVPKVGPYYPSCWASLGRQQTLWLHGCSAVHIQEGCKQGGVGQAPSILPFPPLNPLVLQCSAWSYWDGPSEAHQNSAADALN